MSKTQLFSKKRRENRSKFYTLSCWKRIRKNQLQKEPLCSHCYRVFRRIRKATVCDHEDPCWPETLEGFTRGPFNSLCRECHEEKSKTVDIPKMKRAELFSLKSF